MHENRDMKRRNQPPICHFMARKEYVEVGEVRVIAYLGLWLPRIDIPRASPLIIAEAITNRDYSQYGLFTHSGRSMIMGIILSRISMRTQIGSTLLCTNTGNAAKLRSWLLECLSLSEIEHLARQAVDMSSIDIFMRRYRLLAAGLRDDSEWSNIWKWPRCQNDGASMLAGWA